MRKTKLWTFGLAFLSLAIAACLCTSALPAGLGGEDAASVEEARDETEVELEADQSEDEETQADEAPQMQEVRQWASSADASSQYAVDRWAAYQATGAPDTTSCGDIDTAWSSWDRAGIDWLQLEYSTPVVPTSIEIYQTYHPGAITHVELVDASGATHVVYENTPSVMDECPYTLVIPVEDVDFSVRELVIHVDQSTTSEWNQIDAVELIGDAEAGAAQTAEVAVEVVEVPEDTLPAEPAVTGSQVTGDDYCVGLSIEEIGVAYGVVPDELSTSSGSIAYFCQYYFEPENFLRVDITVYPEESAADAAQRYNESTLFASGNDDMEELSGPWDEGYWHGGDYPHVEFYKGSTYISLFANYYDLGDIPPNAKEATIDLAMTYAERLP
jgi:hypothetical protein